MTYKYLKIMQVGPTLWVDLYNPHSLRTKEG